MAQTHYIKSLKQYNIFGFLIRSDANQAIQPQKMARALISDLVKNIFAYYFFSFFFTHAQSRFSYDDTAKILM